MGWWLCSRIQKVCTEIPVKIFRSDYTAYIGYISKLGRAGYHASEGRLMNAKADKTLTKKLVGHKGTDITYDLYAGEAD